jgi:hypothetical protein
MGSPPSRHEHHTDIRQYAVALDDLTPASDFAASAKVGSPAYNPIRLRGPGGQRQSADSNRASRGFNSIFETATPVNLSAGLC